MKNHIKKALALFISAVMIATSLLIPTAAFAKSSDSNKKAEYVEGEVICVLNNNATSSHLKAASTKTVYGSSFSQKEAYKIGSTQTVILKSNSLTTKEMVAKLKKNSAVKYAIPNYIKHAYSITDDTYSNYQWALDNTGQNGGTAGLDTNADALWTDAAKSDKDPIVAIVDTGIDSSNPELKDNLWVNPYGKKLLGKNGRDFTGTIDNGEPYDDNGHGTHCAGIIAAQADNQSGIAGVNKTNVKIMALKFLNSDGGGDLEGAIAAYDYLIRAVKLGANVVACNNSWGGAGDLEEMELLDSIYDELGKLGVITFAAAGNDSYNIDIDENDPDPIVDTPAACQSDYVITVAASNEKDELADFSSFGKKTVDIAAPGANILSTVSYNCFNPTIYNTDQRAALCSEYQNYDSPVSAGTFGYLNDSPYDTEGSYAKFISRNYETSYVDGFGTSGKALQISLNEEITKKRSNILYVFEVPFTLDDEKTDYSISMAMKGNNYYECEVFDVPATATFDDVYMQQEETFWFDGTDKDNYWSFISEDIETNPEKDEDDLFETEYEQAKDRKLLFVVTSTKNDTVITIDDLAISKQGADSNDFGKFDFYNGTSMATPYATGAAALIKNARPDASTLDIINMIKSTGRYSAALEGKTQNAKVLSLDSVDNIPPMITDIAYNKDKNVEIQGSFRDITKVTANGAEVTPISTSNNSIVIKDNKYSTKAITVTVENAVGSDTFDTLISNKPDFKTIDAEDAPEVANSVALPTGEAIYFVNSSGVISIAEGEEDESLELEFDDIGLIDTTKIFKGGNCSVTTAAYLNNAIYACVLHSISGSYNEGSIIGYEAALVRYDIDKMTTTKIADIPDESLSGATLAVYNGSLHLIGGCDFTDTFECTNSVYKLSAAKKFVKMSATLPEGRAGAKFMQYKNKLIGMYGMNNNGTMPSIIIFDGKTWKKSKVTLDSDDTVQTTLKNHTVKMFTGNLGYSKNGLFANGSYVYGIGDSFTYNVDNDTVTACANSAKNTLDGVRLLGTTCGSYFVGFEQKSDDDEKGGEMSIGALATIFGDGYSSETGAASGLSDDEETTKAYILNTGAVYPEIDVYSEIAHGEVNTEVADSYLYGDAVNITVTPDAGYAITSIKANGKVLSKNSNRARIVVNSAAVEVSNTFKLVASPITSLKVTKAGTKVCTLTWNKAKTGTGYQVQRYEGGKWKTVATIKNLKTTTYKAAVKAGTTAKYRVRAYGTYNKKTVYGAATGKSIYVPKAQKIKSAKGAKGSFTVTFNKDGNASGYVIEYSKTKNFKKKTSVTIKKNATVKKKIKVDAGKYNVRVRSYKKIDGKTIYGAYSKTKTVTVK